MNIEATKIDLEEIVAHTVDGKPLTREAYIKAIKQADKDIENGNSISHEQLQKNVITL